MYCYTLFYTVVPHNNAVTWSHGCYHIRCHIKHTKGLSMGRNILVFLGIHSSDFHCVLYGNCAEIPFFEHIDTSVLLVPLSELLSLPNLKIPLSIIRSPTVESDAAVSSADRSLLIQANQECSAPSSRNAEMRFKERQRNQSLLF